MYVALEFTTKNGLALKEIAISDYKISKYVCKRNKKHFQII